MRLCLISASACVNRGEADERQRKTAPHCLLDRGLEVSLSSEKWKNGWRNTGNRKGENHFSRRPRVSEGTAKFDFLMLENSCSPFISINKINQGDGDAPVANYVLISYITLKFPENALCRH